MADIKLKTRIGGKIRDVVDKKCDGNVTKFANEIGVSRMTVHTWFSGEKMPSVESVVALCEKYKIRSEEILGL